MAERIITTGDLELWSRSHGVRGNPAVLLLAGDTQSSMEWPAALLDLLAEGGFEVLTFDYRDTGRSTHREFSGNPYNFDDLAADAVAVLDGWEVERAHVVGFGMGSAIGQFLALDHRERLSALTLLGACALDVDFFGNWERSLSGEPTADGLPTPRRWFVELVLGDHSAAGIAEAVDYWRRLAGDELPFDEPEFRGRLAAAAAHAGRPEPVDSHPHGQIRHDWTPRGSELPGITTPTLVIQAPLDPISPPPHGRHLAEVIPGARLVEIPGMGHALTSAVVRPLADAITSQCPLSPRAGEPMS